MVAATWQWAWQPRRRHSCSIPSTALRARRTRCFSTSVTAPLQDTTRCCRHAGWLLRDIRTWKQDPGNDPACVLGNHVVGPFCISVLVIPVVTGCQQSGYLASRIIVSTTGWSDNHGPSRGEPWEPAAEQPGSFLGSVLAHVGECWRVFASVSSAEPDDPEAVSTEGGQNIPSRQHMAKSAVNLRPLARAVAARASAPTFHYHLGKGNKGGRSLVYPLKTKRLFSNPEIVPALRTIQIIAATTTARCPASRRVARAKRHRPRVRMQAAMLVETARAPPCSTTVYRRRVSERASRHYWPPRYPP